jgi:hypothetical protein
LKNGSVIKGVYAGGSEDQISFRVGSTVQKYAVEDVASLRFDSQDMRGARDDSGFSQRDNSRNDDRRNSDNYSRDTDNDRRTSDRPSNNDSRAREEQTYEPTPIRPEPTPVPTPMPAPAPQYSGNTVTVPMGARLTIRTIDPVDSDRNRVGDKFAATLDEPLYVNDVLVVPRGANVYGRLDDAREAGHMTGRSQLKLSLTGIVVNGQTLPLSTGDYELSGKSRGANTAKKVGGGAAVGAVIGAIVGGGRGAAVGAGVGAGAGTAVQIATKGEQVHVPSETLLEFSLNQPVTMPVSQAR